MARRSKRILIVRQDRVGDVVLSTALPREIKKREPDAFVAVMVREYTRDLYLHNPHVDVILTDDYTHQDSRETFWAKVRELRSYRFSHALMLLPQARINYMTFCAGIPHRVGVGVILFHVITFASWVRRHEYRDPRHEADYCLDLLRKIGIEARDIRPEIHLSPQERIQVEALRSQLKTGGRFIVGVHSTSGRSAPNWPASSYRELVQRLAADPGYAAMVTDRDVPAELLDLEDVIYPNVGSSLRKSLVSFAALDVLVSASTGPMHVCAALGVRTVSMFCPLPACAPIRWGPVGNLSEILLPAPDYCAHACPGDPSLCAFEGEGGIGVDQVLERVGGTR